jgi:thioredoxin family protein
MRENRDVVAQVEREITLDRACLEALERLREQLRVLVLAEDWCRDSVDNLPILMALAVASGKLDVRIFSKEQAPELMALYLKDGKYESLPVFVFLADDFSEIGRFIERPDTVTELRGRLKRERGGSDLPMSALPDQERATVRQLIEEIRLETRPIATAEVQRCLTTLFEAHSR